MTNTTHATPSVPRGGTLLGCGVIVLFVILGLVFGYMIYEPKKKTATTALQLPAEECWTTPTCSIKLDRHVKIFWDDPIWVKWPGVKDTARYQASVDTTPPEGVEKGDAVFGSSDPKNPRVRIRKYNVITVGGR